jgi:threonine 3-dehydrogenase
MVNLVTGGLGLVGAELVHLLVKRGEKVVILDISTNYSRINDIKDKVKVIRGDLGNLSEVLNVIKTNNITHIYHIGAMLAAASEDNPWGAFHTNVIGTYNILEAARLYNIEKVIFTSTLSTYGLEIKDEINDTTIQRPTTMYGISKLWCEGMGRFYSNKFALDFRSVRFPAVVGPGDTVGHWWNKMLEDAIRGTPHKAQITKEFRAPMIFYKDAALACDMILHAPKDNIKMINYNVFGVAMVIAEELEKVIRKYIPTANITYKTDQFRPALSSLKKFDDSYARMEWNWSPEYTTIDKLVLAFIEDIETNQQH